ncbi:rRNA-processing protein EFG1 [Coprinopsis cinerea okayama7|uniref:rRNA-processing protein EFG1 n=1 Tax=Rhizoctonia solani TaxID=456999 RepID=A0A0K6FLK2_9AGAM|nr:rRNA-processing protein EFG1 [Coprinopsis cinerea okayama7\
MPPLRYRDSKSRNSKHHSDARSRKYQKSLNPNEPGIQKIKSALRQTHRLLAKDNLAADIRIASERKLKSLEADLARAEIRKKERKIAVRYHKIKFFDKQKITRKINQTKRALEAPELDKKERKRLQEELLSHRVDLNYILNYPKLDKYIALYPSSESSDEQTDKLREERRLLVRQAMQRGEMDDEPEIRSGNKQDQEPDGGESAELGGSDDDDETEEGEEPKPSKVAPKRVHASASTVPRSEKHTKLKSKEKSKQFKSAPQPQLVSAKDDDFFDP